jgi:hypothetical protein
MRYRFFASISLSLIFTTISGCSVALGIEDHSGSGTSITLETKEGDKTVKIFQKDTESNVIIGGNNLNIHETETRALPAANINAVHVSSEFGEVTLAKSDDSTIHIEAIKSIGGKRKEEELRSLLKKVTIQSTVQERTLTVSADTSSLPKDVGAAVSFVIHVPRELALNAVSQNGAVTIKDVGTTVEASSQFGEVHVTGATGRITAKSDNGAVIVENALESPQVKAHSEFGAVTVRGAGKIIDAVSNNGAVVVANVPGASAIVAQSEFGSVTLTDVAGTVKVRSNNGSVKVQDAAVRDTLNLHSGFGSVTAEGIKASSSALAVELFSENGAVHYTGPASQLNLSSNFGEVTGDLRAGLAFVGGQAKSQNGSVRLTLPEKLAVNLTAKTNNGGIQTHGLPGGVTGDGQEKSYRTALNGGGPDLTVRSEFGSISLGVGE